MKKTLCASAILFILVLVGCNNALNNSEIGQNIQVSDTRIPEGFPAELAN